MSDEQLAALKAAAEAVVRQSESEEGVSVSTACRFARLIRAASAIALLARLERAEAALREAEKELTALGAVTVTARVRAALEPGA